MNISIIICTYNRSKSLERTLDSIREMAMPIGLEWELIVVDNNSKDDTNKVVEEYQRKCEFSVRYIKEEQQGLSFARNRGVKETKGKIIAFTDDDVLVDKNWLRSISKAFEEYDVACVGGKILPIWEKCKPKWLTEEYYGCLALLDYGERPLYFDKPNIWGANSAVKAEVFQEYGLFDTSLGRIPGKLYAGEETSLFKKILNGGDKIFYSPQSIVHHIIPKERMAKNYIRKWKFDNGELKGILFGDYLHRNILGIPYYVIRNLFTHLFSYILKMINLSEDRFEYQLRLSHTLGFLFGRLQCKRMK